VTSVALALLQSSATAAAEAKKLIQIGVEVVEVDEQKSQNLGIQWMGTLHVSESSVPSLLKIGAITRDTLFADLEFLEQHGAADLLANPKLVASDGTTATFHAGGELPYATSGSLGTVNVQFKPYGINLKISPTLVSTDSIAMAIDAEVSGPDNQNSVTLSGNTVPGIRSRTVSSQVTLGSGITLTLAGLIQTDKEWTRSGVPGLMHLPLLGRLFSYKTQTNQRTSVVIFVTPTILAEPTIAPSPTPAITESDDLLRIEDEKDQGLVITHG
jgi:pilus assembly protein CpaC